MICYRSREEFDQRFDWGIAKEAAESLGSSRSIMTGPVLEVEKYMSYMGEKFAVARYDPCSYLLQSRSMDLMDVGFGSSFLDGVLRIKVIYSLSIGSCMREAHESTSGCWTQRIVACFTLYLRVCVFNFLSDLLCIGGKGLRMWHQTGRIDTFARAGTLCRAAEVRAR